MFDTIPKGTTIDVRAGLIRLRRPDGVGMEISYRSMFENGPIPIESFIEMLLPTLFLLNRDATPPTRAKADA